jgi:hypothetical protein
MKTNIAIVVPTFNRPHCLMRLLAALAKAEYSENTDLYISVDDAQKQLETVATAEQFHWAFGSKKIIARAQHLGLKEHILLCAAIVNEYDAVVLLEDDLVVSPYFFSYTQQALSFYANAEKVAGISLYNYAITESGFYPFYPKHDGSDVYFMQVASSWGQCWTKTQWNNFKVWLDEHPELNGDKPLPEYIKSWGSQSWKKHFIHYLIDTDAYFVFPHQSLSTNFGEPGTNTDRKGLFQTPLMQGERAFQFCALKDSKSTYDAWFELNNFQKGDYNAHNTTIDIYGERTLDSVNTPYLISSKPCSSPIQSFGLELSDYTQNILQDIKGDFFHLGATKDFTDKKPNREAFFLQLKGIKDLVFHDFIESKATERGRSEFEKHVYNQQFPTFCIYITGNDTALFERTLNSISAQHYPFVDVKIFSETKINLSKTHQHINSINVVETTDNQLLLDSLSTASYAYGAILQAGDEYAEGALLAAKNIFKRFVDIHWLYGIVVSKSNGILFPPKPICKRRYTQNSIHAEFHAMGKTSLSSAGLFFSEYIAKETIEKIKMDLQQSIPQQLWLHFINNTPLFSASFYAAYSAEKEIDQFRPFSFRQWVFEKNIPYLRYLYNRQEQFPAVVRFEHKTNAYYLSDY